MNNQEEFQKCIDSPYYFYTTYFKVNGETGKTKLSEEQFNKIFKQMSECKPLKLYTSKRQKMIKVDINNYQELASKTCKDLGTIEANNTHMQMGIITETAELVDVLKKQLAYGKDIDWINVKEEIGDVFWYIANFCLFNGVDFVAEIKAVQKQLSDNKFPYNEDSMFQRLETILLYTNDKTGDDDIMDIVGIIQNLVWMIEECTKFTLKEILQTNIDKLSARFPDGFTQYHALNRNLETERTILEK